MNESMWSKVSLIAVKRLRANVLTLQWQLLTCVFILLFAVLSVTSIEDFEKRLGLWNDHRRSHVIDPAGLTMYRSIQVVLDRPPEKLGILASGIGEEYGSCAIMKWGGALAEITSREKSNRFLVESFRVDLIKIVGLVASLLAIVLAATIFSEERQTGTLQLILSQSIKRFEVLLGEYLGTVISVAFPILICLFALLLVFQWHLDLGLEWNTVLGIGMIFVGSILLISIFTTIGLVTSTLTREQGTSLLLAIVAWMLFVILLPHLTHSIAQYAKPVNRLANIPLDDAISHASLSATSKKFTEEDVKLRSRNLQERFVQAKFWRNLQFLSPFSTYTLAAEALAGTDLASHKLFLDQVSHLARAFREWQNEKTTKYPNRVRTYIWGAPPLELGDLPKTMWNPEPIESRITRALPPLTSLLVANIFLFFVSYLSIVRYDPRFQ